MAVVVGAYFLVTESFVTEAEPKPKNKQEVVIKRPYYYELLHEVYSQIPVTDVETVIIGDSHVQLMPWPNLLASPQMVTMGVGGDTFAGIRDRLDDALRLKPVKIVLMGGTNDINKGKTAEAIVNDILAIAGDVTARLPDCKIFIVSIFPFNPDGKNQKLKNEKVAEINESLQKKSGSQIRVIDLFSTMKTWDPSFFYDDWHLSSKGYLFVRDALKSHI
jgi:hypothetical protein